MERGQFEEVEVEEVFDDASLEDFFNDLELPTFENVTPFDLLVIPQGSFLAHI